MQSLRGASRFVAAILATIAPGAGCTVTYPIIAAGPSFQVHVEDRGYPVYGLRVKLNGSNFSRTTETGEDGTVRFRNIPPGTYQVGAEWDAGMADGAAINVTTSGPKNTTIPLGWPSRPPLTVQALKGILRWPIYREDQLLQVELLDARTGRTQKKTQTTEDGAFHLGIPAPGLYFLRVTPTTLASEGGVRIAGLIPIEVDPRAAHFELELEFGLTSCGVTYVARHTCPQQELSITHLSGQIIDTSGASIARATISLFNPDGTIAEQLTSDEDGKFISTKRLDGNYELAIRATGFTSWRQAVQVTTPKDDARAPSLRVRLGIMGSCSDVTTQ